MSYDLLDGLFPDWEKLTKAERISLASLFEEEMAQQQGRPACAIEIVQQTDDYDAVYSDNTIKIEQIVFEDSNPYPLIYLLTHEGRHAHQDYMLSQGQGEMEEKLFKIWKRNFSPSGYLEKDPDNKLQPLEFDAYQYQFQALEKILSQVKNRYGKRYAEFEGVISLQRAGFEEIIEIGREQYGDNFFDVIIGKVNTKYELIQSFYKRYFSRDSESGFLDYLFDQAENFVHNYFGKDCSWEAFERVVIKSPHFNKCLGIEQQRQGFIERLNKIMKGVFLGKEMNKIIDDQLKEYLSMNPTDPLSLEGFKEHLIIFGYDQLVKRIENAERLAKERAGNVQAILRRASVPGDDFSILGNVGENERVNEP